MGKRRNANAGGYSERDLRVFVKAVKRVETERKKRRESRHAELRRSQRPLRREFVSRLATAGLPQAAWQQAIDLFELELDRAHRDLDDRIRAEEREEWKANGISQAVTLDSSTLSPTEAIALRDHAAMDRWNQWIRDVPHRQFPELIKASHLPTLRRPLDMPPFEELRAIPAFTERVDAVFAGHDTSYQEAVRAAMYLLRKGAPKKFDDDAVRRAQELRRQMLKDIQRAHRACKQMARAQWVKAIRSAILPFGFAVTEAKSERLFATLRPTMKASELTARIAATKYGVAWDHVRRGTIPQLRASKRIRRQGGGRWATQASRVASGDKALAAADATLAQEWVAEEQRQRLKREE